MVEMVADWYGGSTSVGLSRREPVVLWYWCMAVVEIVGWVAFIRLKFT